MHIDSTTVLLSGVFVKLVIAVLFLMFWIYDRRSIWLAWWSAAFALGTVAALLFLVRSSAGELTSIGFGGGALMATMSCSWQGARTFNRRHPLWIPAVLAPALWLTLCFLPGFLDNLHFRVFGSSLLLALLAGLSAFEFWRGRDEQLPSRWPVIIVLCSFSLIFVVRILFIEVLPFPFGVLPERPSSLAAFNLITFFHALVLTVLFVAITKERLELEQRTKAQTDPLTGAFNRRAFMIRGGRLLQRHRFGGAPLCLLFLDIDHFKGINDRLGHAGGDDALIKFVAIMQDNMRPTDFLFRIGGEEFCCLLPYTTGEQARHVAERIRQQFEMTTVEVGGSQVKATVSLGIASTETFGYDLDTLMRRADEALYAAKRQGRNRAVTAEAGPARTNGAMTSARATATT